MLIRLIIFNNLLNFSNNYVNNDIKITIKLRSKNPFIFYIWNKRYNAYMPIYMVSGGVKHFNLLL